MAYRNEKEQAAAVKLEDIAVRRVFEKCSHLPAWRGGPTLKGNLVYKGKAKVERVNVSVNLADAADARGNMLPYMITFDAKKTPVVIQATKDIAATLCSLEASNTDYPL